MPELSLVPDRWLANLLSDIATDHPGVYLAGGRVRDWLLNREGRDVDLCLAGAAIPFARRIANSSGGAFYVLDSQTDAARILYPERGIVVDVASLRGSDIIGDLRARDMTINAMAVRLEDLGLDSTPIIDPCGGQADLKARVLRATSQEAFLHDPVRMLRAVRLEAALGFRIEPVTESWITRDASSLGNSSPERIRYELLQILSGRDPQFSMLRMQSLGLLETALPEVAGLAGPRAAPQPRTGSELASTLAVLASVERLTTKSAWGPVEQATFGPYSDMLYAYFDAAVCDQRTRGLLLRWAALLHRARRWSSPELDESQRVSDEVDAEAAAGVTERFRFSAHEVALVRSTVANANHLLDFAARGKWDRRDLYCYFQRAVAGRVEPLLLAWARLQARTGEQGLEKESLRELAAELLAHYFIHPQELVDLPTIVSGADVMDWLGLEPGPQVGAVLRELRELQALGRFSTREEARHLIRTINPG